jgi:hypothetical protein
VVLGHGGNWYEKNCICARNKFAGATVTQASDFVSAQIYPFVTVAARAELQYSAVCPVSGLMAVL